MLKACLKRMIPAALLFFALALSCGSAEARIIKMIFWYPGEAGSTSDAQPVLDELFKYLNAKIAPDTIGGKYFNTVDGGAAYIAKDKPAVGIVSYAAWVQNRDKLSGTSVLLSTMPSPGGKTAERYALVGRDLKIPQGSPILSSEPLSAAFVRENLFPDIPSASAIASTPQLIAKLKDIGEGKLNAAAILTPTEAATLARLSAPWAKSLKVIAESKPVPTARVLIFDQTWKDSTKFKAALLSAGRDPAARDILDELRLKGFAE